MTKKPSILLDLLAFDEQDGGFTSASYALLEVCKHISSIDFTVATGREHQNAFKEFGFPVLGYSFPRKLRYGINALILPVLARRSRFDAVHSEISAVSPQVAIPKSMTLHDLAFVGNRKAHNDSFGGRLMHYYWNSYYLKSLSWATRVKCISKTTAADLANLAGRSANVDVLYPFFPAPRSLTTDGKLTKELQVVFVGTVVPRKNLGFLIEALSRLRRPWRLHLVGNMAWGSSILRQHEGNQNIVIHGFVPNEQRDKIVAAADIMVLPSVAEGFGYPPLEAASLGTPSLLSDIPIFREIAPHEVLFSLANADELTRMLETLDDATLLEISKAWGRHLQNFSLQAAVQANENYFHKLFRGNQ